MGIGRMIGRWLWLVAAVAGGRARRCPSLIRSPAGATRYFSIDQPAWPHPHS